jgi:hypothetical protein
LLMAGQTLVEEVSSWYEWQKEHLLLKKELLLLE